MTCCTWYQDEYRFARHNIYLGREGDVHTIKIDNQLLDERRTEGLFPDLEKIIFREAGTMKLQRTLGGLHPGW